ncbi:hemolysin family protein [Halovenus sp. HT40]|uniref:hemolysin family protein n=1 Tax=Halovenus sp. HT40 TaxID=3126691 RepID=UPI00300EAEEC
MVDLVLSASQLLLAVFLVILNGFFVASEFAFVRIRSTSVEQLVAEGRAGSGTLQDVVANLDNYLAVTQLGITIASLGLGWVGEPAVAALLEPVLEPILPASLIHLVAFIVGFSVITFLHVVFGELAPKTIAIAEAEKLSLFVAPPMKFFYYIFYPGLVVFNGTANAFTRMIGIPPASETDETLGEREIRRVLARSGEEGHIDMAEVDMIERVFDLDDTIAREVMIPRPDVVSIPADASLTEIRSTVKETKHTRYPVVEGGNDDQVLGFLDVKDVMEATDNGDNGSTAEDLSREIIVVPETMPINDLLLQFRDDQRQMAAIIDEWGALEGIATVEDVVEAVVGDLRDEFDAQEKEPAMQRRDDGAYDIDGSVPLSLASETLGGEFETDGFDTVGGMVLERINRAPEVGDEVEESGYQFEVTEVDGNRILAVEAHPVDNSDDDESE